MISRQSISNRGDFSLKFRLAKFMLLFFEMPKAIFHVERKSRFLRTLLSIYPCCEEIHFGLLDCLAIGFTLACFVGLICVLAG